MEPLPMEKDSESAGAIDLTDKISGCFNSPFYISLLRQIVFALKVPR